MGQTYTVDARFRYLDEKEALRLAQAFRAEEAGRARIRPFDDIEGLMKALFTDNAVCEGPGHYTADFNASYGWERVMAGAFVALAPALADGSGLDICPDSGRLAFRKEEGKVTEERYD